MEEDMIDDMVFSDNSGSPDKHSNVNEDFESFLNLNQELNEKD
jgi:hypothetical protein